MYRIVPIDMAIAALAVQLRVQYGLKLPDAIQLATALDIGADVFVTHDRASSHVSGLQVLMSDTRTVL